MALGLSSQKLLAIDWDRKDLRLVLVRPRADGIDLLKAVSVPIPPEVAMDDAESLGSFVREAMRQARVRAKRALLSIARDQVVLNTLSLPPSPVEDLPAIVLFQIAKELPFAADQATIDFAVCGEFDPKASSRVLVAAVRNEQLEFYLNVAHEAGLTVESIGLRPHANLVAVLSKTPEFESKSLLLVEVGPQLTEIDVIQDGAVAFSRAASVSLPRFDRRKPDRLDDSRIASISVQDRKTDETTRKAVGELMVEVIRSFEAYRATEPGVRVDHVVVCGATGVEAELAESLAGRFATEATLYSPDRALDLTPHRAKELRGFSAAVGLAIGQGVKGPSHFDFLHPKKPVSKRSIRLKKVPAAALTAACLIATGFAAHYRFVKPLEDRKQELQETVSKMQPEEEAIRAFKKQVEALEDWEKSEQVWPEVLVALTGLFPPDQEATVTRLHFEVRKPKKKATLRPCAMRMNLRTASLGKVNELSSTLRKLGFIDVRTGKEQRTGGRRAGNVYSHETSIDAALPQRTKPKGVGLIEPASDEAATPHIEAQDAAKPDVEPSDAAEASPAGAIEARDPRADKPKIPDRPNGGER